MRLSPIVLLALLAGGCSNVHFPYVINVQQGNVVTPDMVAKLKPGMSRSQVRFILGTPLTEDLFRTDRWDYVYEFHKAGVLTEKRRVSLFFKGDSLERMEEVGMGADTASAALLQAAPPAQSGAGEQTPTGAETTVVPPLETPGTQQAPAPGKADKTEKATPLQLTPSTTLPQPATPTFPAESAAPAESSAPAQGQ